MKESLSFFGSFFEVFIRPRKVIRNIIGHDTRYWVWPFILAYSVLAATDPGLYLTFLRKTPPSVLYPLGAGLTVAGMIALFWVFIAFAYFAGKLLGGTGKFEEVTVAYVWCLPPAFIGILLNLLAAVPTWLQIFSGIKDPGILVASKSGWQYLLLVLYYVLIIWSLVLDFIALSEAHRIPVWKSLVIGLVGCFAALVVGISIGIFLVAFGLH